MTNLTGVATEIIRPKYLKKFRPATHDSELLAIASASMESLRTTGAVIFIDIIKEAVDELHSRIHASS